MSVVVIGSLATGHQCQWLRLDLQQQGIGVSGCDWICCNRALVSVVVIGSVATGHQCQWLRLDLLQQGISVSG